MPSAYTHSAASCLRHARPKPLSPTAAITPQAHTPVAHGYGRAEDASLVEEAVVAHADGRQVPPELRLSLDDTLVEVMVVVMVRGWVGMSDRRGTGWPGRPDGMGMAAAADAPSTNHHTNQAATTTIIISIDIHRPSQEWDTHPPPHLHALGPLDVGAARHVVGGGAKVAVVGCAAAFSRRGCHTIACCCASPALLPGCACW